VDGAVLAGAGAAVAGGVTALVLLQMRARRFERLMRQQRFMFDADVQYRRVEEEERHLTRALDQVGKQTNELTSFLQPLRDVVMIPQDRQGGVMVLRPFVDDIGTVAYATVTQTSDGTLTGLTIETFAGDEILTTVAGGRDVIALPPFCKRNYPKGRMSLEELLRNHRVFTSRDRDPSTFRPMTNGIDVAGEMQRMHDMIRDWRRSMPPAELLERDLQVWLGRKYQSQRARWAKTLAA
jgi:hypothetical protein